MHPKQASLFVAGVLLACSLSAQTLEGPAIRVSSRPRSLPVASQAARAANGDLAVVWEDQAANGSRRVWVRRFTASGRPKGREIPVDPSSPKAQQGDPQIAMAPGGGFLVVWDMGDQAFHNAVFGRSFAASGKPLGPAFRLNPGSQDAIELNPAVAATPDGGFVATWVSGPNPAGFQGDDILARRFTAGRQAARPSLQGRGPGGGLPEPPARRGAGERGPPRRLAVLSGHPRRVRDPAGGPVARRRRRPPGRQVPGRLGLPEHQLPVPHDGERRAESLFAWIGVSLTPGPASWGQRCAPDGKRLGDTFQIHDGPAAPFAPPAVAAIPGGGYFRGLEHLVGRALHDRRPDASRATAPSWAPLQIDAARQRGLPRRGRRSRRPGRRHLDRVLARLRHPPPPALPPLIP